MPSNVGGLLVPLILAVLLALVISLTKPMTGMAIALGAIVLLVAFLSTTAGLYLLIISMLLGPEFIVGGLGAGASATEGRGMTLRLDDFLLVMIGFAWLAKAAIHKEGAGITKNPLNRWIMLFIAVSVFSTLFGVMQGRVTPKTGFFFLLKYYEYVFIYFMVLNAVTNPKQTKTFVTVSFVTCFLVALFAISQIPSGERASAPFEGETGEPNTLGGYLVFMLSIATGLLLTPGAVQGRIPLMMLVGAGFIGLMATLSRSSFLAAGVVGMAVLGILAARKSLWLPVAVLVSLGGVLAMPGPVKERVLYTFTQAPEEGQVRIGRVRVDTSTSERLRSWKQSFAYLAKHPVLGTGVAGGPFMDAMYPRVLTETGLAGMAAFLAMLWAIFRTAMSSYQSAADPFHRGLALGFLLGFLGLLVHSVGANTFLIVRIMEPFWLYAALVVKLRMFQDRAVPPDAKPQIAEEGRRAYSFGFR